MKKKIIVQSFLLLNQKPSSFRLSQKTPSTYFQHGWSESFILMNLDDEFFLGLDSQKRIELLPIRRRIPRSSSTIRPYLLSREIQPDTHHLMLPQIQVNKHNIHDPLYTRARGSERVVLDRFADLVSSMSFFICPIGSIPSIAVTNQVSTLINYWDVNPLLISGFLLNIDKKNSSYHLISV